MTRGEIAEEIEAVVGKGMATLVHQGLAKVLEDRAEFEVVAEVPPDQLREKVFTAAAEQRKELAGSSKPGLRDPFRRDEVLEAVGREYGLPPEQVAAGLFADLKDENRLLELRRPVGPGADRPLQPRARPGGPAAVGPARGRGPRREAEPISAVVPAPEVPSPPLSGEGLDGRRLHLPPRRPAQPLHGDQQVRAPDGPLPAGPPALRRLPDRRRAALGQEARAPDLPPRGRRRPRLALPGHRPVRPGRDRRLPRPLRARSPPTGTVSRGDRPGRPRPRGGLGPRLPLRPQADTGSTSSSRSSASGSGRASTASSGSSPSTARPATCWRSPTR